MLGKLRQKKTRMRDKFFKWLIGTPPAIVGGWWNRAGVCLVRKLHLSDARAALDIIYEPCGLLSANEAAADAPIQSDIVNALRCAAEHLGNEKFYLAVGVPSGDIFIKNIEIPSGLSEKQIEQLSVVEAVSNLPVPPEEICADFLRGEIRSDAVNERIDVAFCKRGLVDELSLLAEDAGVVLGVVDRDVQAVHDATLWCAARQLDMTAVSYPLGILFAGDAANFLVCRSALDHSSYLVNGLANALTKPAEDMALILAELQAYCRRAGLSVEKGEPLAQLYLIDAGNGAELMASSFDALTGNAARINPKMLVSGDSSAVPIFGLMVAIGMAFRTHA
jgi:hypothetical protein